MLTVTQVDQLGQRLKTGDVSQDDLKLLDSFRRSFAAAYEHVINTVRATVAAEPTGRPHKSTFSIIEKLRRQTVRLSQMQDIAGCRLVVADIPTQDDTTSVLANVLPRAQVIDRRQRPSHGYRAVHLISTVD